MIAVIDYDAGNLKSVAHAFHYLGEDVTLTRDPETLLCADKVVLPGVGSFGDAMKKLRNYALTDVIHTLVEKEIPLLGICLGLQLLFEESEESPGVKGLGIFKGKIVRFDKEAGYKIPQIGWNALQFQNPSRLLSGLPEEPYVYFVHSYYAKAEDRSIVTATCLYANEADAVVERGNLLACQFHPEKSGEVGLSILEKFICL